MKAQRSRSYTLPELAEAAGMTVRNVRSYQTRGLIPPPVRRGRHSVYNSVHLERLRQIHQARQRGASLNLIADYLASGGSLSAGIDRAWLPGRGRTGSGSRGRGSARATRPVPTASLDAVMARSAPDGAAPPDGAAGADGAHAHGLDAILQHLIDTGVVVRSRGGLVAERGFVSAVGDLMRRGASAVHALEIASAAAEAGRAVRAAAGKALGTLVDDERTRVEVLSLATGVFTSVITLDLDEAGRLDRAQAAAVASDGQRDGQDGRRVDG